MRDISLHLMDIVQNSISAKANLIQIGLAQKEGLLKVSIIDNGTGMSKEILSKVESPFTTTRTTRKVGLGIPMFKQNAIASGGSFTIDSVEGKGTAIEAVFDLNNIDCIPLGDVAETILSLVVGNPALDFILICSAAGKEYQFNTQEIRRVLGPVVPLDLPDVSVWMKDDLNKGMKDIFGGVQ